MDAKAMPARGIMSTHERVTLCTADLTDEEAGRVISGLTPVIWQLGHITLTEAGWVTLAGVPVELPGSYATLFKRGTGGRAEYPLLAEVRQAFERTHEALLKAAATADYDTPTPSEGRSYSNVAELMVSACVHRGYHIGKMTTLRALLGKRQLF
jgi:hypothetical protein